MDPEAQAIDDTEPIWPTISTDLSSARSAARSITLDTNRAGADGRFLSLESRFDTVGTRLLDLEKKVLDERAAEGVADELVSHFLELRAAVSDTTSRFDSLVARIAASDEERSTSLMQTMDGFDTRIAGVENTRLEQAEELRELMSYLERAFTSVDALSSRLDDELGEQTGRAEELRSLIEGVNLDLQGASARIDELSSLTEQRSNEFNEQLDAVRGRSDQLDRRADEIITRTDHLDSRIDSSLARSDQLDQRIDGALNRTEQVDDRLSEAIERNDQRVEEVFGRSDQLDQRIDDVIGRSDQTNQRIDDFNDRNDQTNQRIDDVIRRSDQTNQRIDDANDRSDRNEQRIDAVANRVEEAGSRIAATETHVSETIADAKRAVERAADISAGLEQVVETRTSEIQEHLASRIEEARSQLARESQHSTDALGSRVDDLTREVQESTAHIHSRVDEVAHNAHENSQRIDARIDDLTQRSSETVNRIAATEDRLNETIIGVREAVEQTAELGADLERSVDSRLNDAEQRSGDRIADVREHLARELRESEGRVNDRAEEHQLRLDEQSSSLDSARSELEGRLGDLENRTSDTERGLSDRIDEAREQLAQQIRDSEETLDDRIAESATQVAQGADQALTEIDDRLNRVEGSLGERIADIRSGLDERVTAIETRVSTQVNNLESGLVDQVIETRHILDHRVADAESRMAKRVADVEATVSKDRLDELKAGVQAAHDEARTAQELAENLRVLQTDLVRALEHELSGQADRLRVIEVDIGETSSGSTEVSELRQSLANAEARIEHAEATIASLASRSPSDPSIGSGSSDDGRLDELETRFFEAARVIERLSELQHQTATIDGVNNSLTSVIGGIEHTSHEIEGLRGQLEIALTRISYLEGSAGSIDGTPGVSEQSVFEQPPAGNPAFDQAPAENDPTMMFHRPGDETGRSSDPQLANPSAQYDPKLFELSADNVQESGDESSDDDSGWFAESYAKKSKGRFRRG